MTTADGYYYFRRDFGFSSFLGYIDVGGRLRGFDFVGRLSPRCRKQSYVRVHRPHGSNLYGGPNVSTINSEKKYSAGPNVSTIIF